jgi:hypothetical protein
LISDFSIQDESEAMQGDGKVDDDYATSAIWTTPVEDGGIDESGADALLPVIFSDLLADKPDEILHNGCDDPVLF